jgi:phage virion morphogenesis protein
MAGASVKIDYEFADKEITKRLKALADAGEDLEPFFTDVGEGLLNSHHDRWEQQVDPSGDAWQALSDKYLRSKKKRESKFPKAIMRLEGFMFDTLAYNADSQGLELGTNRVQGASMQFGDEKRGIPQRKILGVSEDDEIMIIDRLTDHFESALR